METEVALVQDTGRSQFVWSDLAVVVKMSERTRYLLNFYDSFENFMQQWLPVKKFLHLNSCYVIITHITRTFFLNSYQCKYNCNKNSKENDKTILIF